MIKVKVNQIVNAKDTIERIGTYRVSGKYAFAIARLMREIEMEKQTFDMARAELIKEYANKDEKGELIIENGNVHLTEENIARCNEALNEVLSQEVELNTNPLKYEWFDKVELTAVEAGVLEPFMEVEE